MFGFNVQSKDLLKSLGGFFVVFLFALASNAYKPKGFDPGAVSDEKPKILDEIGIDEKLGDKISLDTKFYDSTGEIVTIGSLIKSGRPAILSFVYYNCPSLCGFHLNGVTEVINQLKKSAGKDFDLIAVSMDSSEGPELASDKKDAYLTQYKRPTAAAGWHFLTGSEENVRKLANEVGFKFKWDDNTKQFAHSAAAIFISPEGKISRYLHGIKFDKNTFNLAIVESSNGKVGNIVDQLVMYCFDWDPSARKFSLQIFNLVRIVAIALVLILAMFLIPAWLKDRKNGTPA